MKTIIKTQQTYKSVKAGVKKCTVFVADDGQEFTGASAEKDCLAYEKNMAQQRFFAGIEKRMVSINFIMPDEWYRPKTEEELEVILRYFGYHEKCDNVVVNGASRLLKPKPQVGEWISQTYSDGGDSHGTIYIYTLDFILSEMGKFFSRFEN
jgi:hypothetical protein